MLYSTLHHPSIYNKSYSNTSDEKLYYSNIIAMLRDVYENCIILSDTSLILISSIKKYIDEWPEEYRILAKRLLKHISAKNRIVCVNTNKCSIDNENCYNVDCEAIQNIVNCNKDITVVLNECTNCLGSISGEVIELEKYQLSNFVNKKRRDTYTINYSDRTPIDYANLIFIPIFRYCNSIKIIDRLIGSHIRQHPGTLKDNYKRGLDFLARCIASATKKNIVIELYTSIVLNKRTHELNDIERENVRSTIQNIESYIESLNQRYKLSIKPIFKEDRTSFIHDRYIITDQIGVFIGRGFDLLDSRYNVNDNTIGLLESYNSVEANIRSLIDLKNAI